MPRLRLIFGTLLVALVLGAASWGSSPAAAQPGCDSNPPVNCPNPPTTTAQPDPPTTDPDPTTTTGSPPTTEPTITTQESTTTAAPITAPPTTAPPTTLPTTAPPELAPGESTTTAVVGELSKVTADTPSLSGVIILVLLGILGSAVVLGAGYVNDRR